MKKSLSSLLLFFVSFTINAQIQTSLKRASDQPDPSVTTPVHFKATFSELVMGFDASDISFEGSTVEGSMIATVTGLYNAYDIYVTGMIPTGVLKLTIRPGAASGNDISDVRTTAGATISIVIKAASPTVTINQGRNQTDPTKYGDVSFDVKFSVPVRGFDASFVSLAGSTAGGASVVSVSSTHVTVRATTSSGVIKVTILAGAGVSAEGHTSLPSTSRDNAVAFEWTPPPTLTIGRLASQPDTASETSIKFRASFSVPVNGFDASDISLTGSSATGKTEKEVSGGPQIYTITIYNAYTSSGKVVVAVPANAAKSNYTSSNSLASTNTDNGVYFDMPPPSVYTGTTGPDPTNSPTITFFASFSHEIVGFSAADISFVGSTAGGTLKAIVSRAGSTRDFNIVVSGMTSAGNVVVSVPAGAVRNREGKANAASRPMPAMDNVVRYSGIDPGIPKVTINQSAGQADPTVASPILFTANFTEDVSGLNASDLLYTGSTVGGALVGTITRVTNREYKIAISGMTTAGTLVVSVRAGAGYNVINQYNVASTSTDNSVTYNLPVTPVASIGDVVAYESEGVATLTIGLSQTIRQAVTIQYSTADGTAVSGKTSKDYQSVSSSAVIQPGQLNTTLVIPINNDNISESSEIFYVNLIKCINCNIGDASAKVTILNGRRNLLGRVATNPDSVNNISVKESTSRFEVNVYPNPSNGEFVFEIVSRDNAPSSIRVVDNTGHTIENRETADTKIQIGKEWSAGMYLVDVVQGLNRKTIKLIKF